MHVTYGAEFVKCLSPKHTCIGRIQTLTSHAEEANCCLLGLGTVVCSNCRRAFTKTESQSTAGGDFADSGHTVDVVRQGLTVYTCTRTLSSRVDGADFRPKQSRTGYKKWWS